MLGEESHRSVADQFEQSVWTTLRLVPEGKVISYGELARKAGFPGRSRHVGACLKKLPKGSSLPWHRVVNAQRKLSFPPDSEKYREQKQRLLAESVMFSGSRIEPEYFLD